MSYESGGLHIYATQQPTTFFSPPQPRRWRCGTCGFETEEGAFATGSVVISILPYEGRYCLKCYAAWIARNIPKMEEVKDSEPPAKP